MDPNENEEKTDQMTVVAIDEPTNEVIVKTRCCTKENLKEQALLIATIVSVVLGIAVGLSLRTIKCPAGRVEIDLFFSRQIPFESF